MLKYLPKSEWPVLLKTWLDRGPLYAPLPHDNPDRFGLVNDPVQVRLGDGVNPRSSAKSLFLPQSQVMLRDVQGKLVPVEDIPPETIVVGMRPCDARAMTLLDSVFLAEPHVDPYWKARREKTIIVSMACTAPCDTCFCMAVGCGPFDLRGSDAVLIDTGDAYLVQLNAEKAAPLFASLVEAFSEQSELVQPIREAAESKIAVPFTTDRVKEKLNGIFDSPFWGDIQQACLGCGVCTFLCPTCHCFDIVDETRLSERVRNWDTCMFRIYSQEASGHNPRNSNLERTRNRIMHKYAYFPEKHGQFACTGCGRCVRHCPVNIDIREIIQNALERE